MPVPRLIARVLAHLIAPLLGRDASDDPWERVSARLPARAFGRGSLHEFRWYFEGESGVRVESLAAICEWLAACEYVDDRALFQETDFWQHPRTFEQLRRGDCEDRALWAWRKLVELGYDAELVCGEWDVTRDDAAMHAWVLYRDGGREFILEAVSRSPDRMVRALEECRAQYRPHAAVDARFRTTVFAGRAIARRERRASAAG